ncbi:hypothetical protein V8B97DRAFT_1590590 [Scleroderma yunnanense]
MDVRQSCKELRCQGQMLASRFVIILSIGWWSSMTYRLQSYADQIDLQWFSFQYLLAGARKTSPLIGMARGPSHSACQFRLGLGDGPASSRTLQTVWLLSVVGLGRALARRRRGGRATREGGYPLVLGQKATLAEGWTYCLMGDNDSCD